MREPREKAADMEDAAFMELSETSTGALPLASCAGAPAKLRGAWLAKLPRLPRLQDNSQKKALSNIFKFMALALVFTLIARGTAGVTLAKVDTVTPYSGEILVSVPAAGTVQAASSHSVTVPVGLTVKEVLVVPGQTVKAGDTIAQFDAAEVAAGRRRAQLALDEMNLNLQKLERGQPYDGSALVQAQNALTWAEQDYTNTKTAGDASIATAQTALAKAQNALAALQNTADPARGPEEITAAEVAVTNAQAALDAAIRDADIALQAAARAIETENVNLAAAQQAGAAARQNAADTTSQNTLDAETLRLDIEKQQTLIAAFDAIADATVTAGADGVVLEVISSGAVTGTAAVAEISNAGGGYLALAEIADTDANKLANGFQVNITTQQGYYGGENPGIGTVLSISPPNAEGTVQITVRLPAYEWKHGQSVQLEIVLSRQQYQSCVPLSALGQGQEGYYVFVMEQRSGVLGVENIVKRVPVTLLARDNSIAAVEGGIFGGERVISRTTKPLADGDKVRVRQP